MHICVFLSCFLFPFYRYYLSCSSTFYLYFIALFLSTIEQKKEEKYVWKMWKKKFSFSNRLSGIFIGLFFCSFICFHLLAVYTFIFRFWIFQFFRTARRKVTRKVRKIESKKISIKWFIGVWLSDYRSCCFVFVFWAFAAFHFFFFWANSSMGIWILLCRLYSALPNQFFSFILIFFCNTY